MTNPRIRYKQSVTVFQAGQWLHLGVCTPGVHWPRLGTGEVVSDCYGKTTGESCQIVCSRGYELAGLAKGKQHPRQYEGST